MTDRVKDTLLEAICHVARGLLFSRRKAFFRELQPMTHDGHRISWPDALMFLDWEDFERAKEAVGIE